MNVLEDLQGIFRDFFDEEDMVITDETTFEDIEDWDSMAQINIVVSVEKHFKVKFNVNEIASIHSIKDIIDLVNAKLA